MPPGGGAGGGRGGDSQKEPQDFILVETEQVGVKLSETYSVMRDKEFDDYKKKLQDTYKKDLDAWKNTSEAERGEKPVKTKATIKASGCTQKKAEEFAAQMTKKIEEKREKAEAENGKKGG